MKKNTDFSTILNKAHENKWVALSADRTKLLDSADTLRELRKRIKDTTAVYMKVLPSDMSFAF